MNIIEQKACGYVRGQKGVPGFDDLMAWLDAELRQEDERNREIGFENRISKAKFIAEFRRKVAAWQAPEPDRDSEVSDAGSRSAAICM